MSSYREEFIKGNLTVSVDLTQARNWLLYKGQYCYKIWWLAGTFLAYLPLLLSIAIAIYAVLHNLWLLLGLPLILIAFLLASPYAGCIGSWSKIATWALFLLTFFNSSQWALVFGIMLLTFGSLSVLNKFAQECLMEAIRNHEDFFDTLVDAKIITIKAP